MVDAEDEQLYCELGALLNGRSTSDVIPALIVTSARALALEADGDQEKLVLALTKFAQLLAEEALDMLNKDNDGRHVNPH